MFVSRIRLHKKLMPCRFIAIVLDIGAGSDLSDDDSAQKFWCDFKQKNSKASLNAHLMHKKLFFSALAMHEFIDSYNLLLIIVQNCFYGAQWSPWLAAESAHSKYAAFHRNWTLSLKLYCWTTFCTKCIPIRLIDHKMGKVGVMGHK